MAEEYVIGVDLGGTRMRAALMDDDLAIRAREETLTHAENGFEANLDRMKNLILSVWPAGQTVEGIGVSIPGPTNPFTGVVELGTNLKGWAHIPLAELLSQEFGVPVYLGNDANVAALAEATRGAAAGYKHVIFITLSTGVGTGIIVDGRLLLGREGLAGEAGHIVINVDGDRVSTFEKEASGTALGRKARERVEAGARSLILSLAGGDAASITGKTVSEAAARGDALALELIHNLGFMAGLGVVSLLHVFNPEIIVFGGPVSGLGERLFGPMRAAIEQNCITPGYWNELVIALAGLGENVSLVGAGVLVLTHGGVESIARVKARLKAAAED
ncbi:MAG: ROK family protein [Anaerolineae bacterium]|nr:ROK family protein [Anaerolineae bacterium]